MEGRTLEETGKVLWEDRQIKLNSYLEEVNGLF
jgi:hypothetical protein